MNSENNQSSKRNNDSHRQIISEMSEDKFAKLVRGITDLEEDLQFIESSNMPKIPISVRSKKADDVERCMRFLLLTAAIDMGVLVGKADNARSLMVNLHDRMKDVLFTATDSNTFRRYFELAKNGIKLSRNMNNIPEVLAKVNTFIMSKQIEYPDGKLYQWSMKYNNVYDILDKIANGCDLGKSMSARKRVCMYLRWMVRPYPDLGILNNLDKKDLYFPVDKNVGRVLEARGIIKEADLKYLDWNIVEKATKYARNLCPDDPIGLDYPFFILGRWINNKNVSEKYLNIISSYRNKKPKVHVSDSVDQRNGVIKADINEDILVYAGPGTGKTTSMLDRAIYLMGNKKVNSDEILILTFTRYANEEMKRKLIPGSSYLSHLYADRGIEIPGNQTLESLKKGMRTINSFMGELYEMVKNADENENFYSSTEEASEDTLTRMMSKEVSAGNQELIAKISKPNYDLLLSEYESYLGDEVYEPVFRMSQHSEVLYRRRDISNMISFFKIRLFKNIANANVTRIKYGDLEKQDLDLKEISRKCSIDQNKMHECFDYYQDLLETKQRYDVQDMFIRAFQKMELVKDKIKNKYKYKYIFVDEMQDLNKLQISIILRLSRTLNTRLLFVGDINQAIYQFNQGNPMIYNEKEFDSFRRYVLTTNFRSNAEIIDRVNQQLPIIKYNNALAGWYKEYITFTGCGSYKPDYFSLNISANPKQDNGGEVAEISTVEDIIYKLKTLESNNVKDIAFISFSKKELRKTYSSIEGYKKCFYPPFRMALQYTKLSLLLEHEGSNDIEINDLKESFKSHIERNLKRPEYACGIMDDPYVIDNLISCFVKSIWKNDENSPISIMDLRNFNIREFALNFFATELEGYLKFINLHQVKGLEYEAVFYIPSGKRGDAGDHICNANLNYIAYSRAKSYLYIWGSDGARTKKREYTKPLSTNGEKKGGNKITRICNKCDTENDSDANFCKRCKNNLRRENMNGNNRKNELAREILDKLYKASGGKTRESFTAYRDNGNVESAYKHYMNILNKFPNGTGAFEDIREEIIRLYDEWNNLEDEKEENKCKKCNCKNDSDAKFCKKCGEDIL